MRLISMEERVQKQPPARPVGAGACWSPSSSTRSAARSSVEVGRPAAFLPAFSSDGNVACFQRRHRPVLFPDDTYVLRWYERVRRQVVAPEPELDPAS